MNCCDSKRLCPTLYEYNYYYLIHIFRIGGLHLQGDHTCLYPQPDESNHSLQPSLFNILFTVSLYLLYFLLHCYFLSIFLTRTVGPSLPMPSTYGVLLCIIHFISLMIYNEVQQLWCPSLCTFLHPNFITSILDLNVFHLHIKYQEKCKSVCFGPSP